MDGTEKARFDIRLTKEQKELFEYAAQLGGYRNLTDYVINVLMEKSSMIIETHHVLLASTKDQEVFFDAVTSTIEPHEALKAAASKHQQAIEKRIG